MPSGQLPKLLDSLHHVMSVSLGIAGKAVSHPTTKGDMTENNWINFLNSYLPKRYMTSKAFVIDSRDNCSDQVDVVIHDRHYSPFVFDYNGARYVPAESVYAAFEVKQSLNVEHVRYAGDKVASVRQLYRTSKPIYHVDGVSKPKSPPFITGGLLCIRSDWIPCFGEPLNKSLEALDAEKHLNMVFVVESGLVECTLANNGLLNVKRTISNLSLPLFLYALIEQLQDKGTVSRLDALAYAEWLPREHITLS